MNHACRPLRNVVPEARDAASRILCPGFTEVAAAVLCAVSFSAQALPTDGAITTGTGTVGPAVGGTMTVDQTSQNLAINWLSFNIGSGETVNFVQPNAAAIALNRVLGADGSAILGKLNANGQVWILNPNGVLFGKGAEVNVGGLVASTLGLTDADFLAGKRTFSGSGGDVTNRGKINAGYAALLGGQVRNEGVIAAKLGTVALAAGNKVTLDFAGDRLLGVQVDEGALRALAENKNLLQADGGLVVMTAKAKDALLDTAVNNTGVVQARTIENRNGRILLLGDMETGTTNVAGTLDASAPNGGDGGFIETSAARVKVADGTVVTTRSANGRSGTWLIDPVDFTISAGSGALTGSGIGATTLTNNLGLSNIVIATDGSTGGNGDIFVNAPVSWSANTLKLIAHSNIYIDANLNGSGAAKLYLAYGQQTANGNGYDYYLRNGAKVNLPAGANFTTEQGYGADNTVLGDGQGTTTNWTVITALGAAGSVTGTDLQGMSGNLAGNYVLGADIGASATAGWNAGAGFVPVGDNITKFTGKFSGLGHTITGLTINRLATNYVGLFGYATGTLRDIGLLNSNISGWFVTGSLAGRSDGAVIYSYADGGSVAGDANIAGGLIGQTGGSVSYSYANVSVTGNNNGVSSTAIGGLVGGNNGSISNSYATGSVHGGTDVGGLVGQVANGATVTNAYSTGAVTWTTSGGGLIGWKGATGTVTNSYWDTTTSGVLGSAAGTGKTTAEMKTLATFAGWDIDAAGGTGKVWRIYEGQSTPLLRHYLTPLTVTANNASKTYDGNAYSGGNGVGYSSVPNTSLLGTAGYGGTSQGATAVGSYTITPSGLYSTQRGYDIAYAGGTLTIAAAPAVPTVPGAPVDGYTGATTSASAIGGSAAKGDAAPGTTILASADGATAAGFGFLGLSIRSCGINLPPALSDDCR